jgi:hypothetical protein
MLGGDLHSSIFARSSQRSSKDGLGGKAIDHVTNYAHHSVCALQLSFRIARAAIVSDSALLSERVDQ